MKHIRDLHARSLDCRNPCRRYPALPIGMYDRHNRTRLHIYFIFEEINAGNKRLNTLSVSCDHCIPETFSSKRHGP